MLITFKYEDEASIRHSPPTRINLHIINKKVINKCIKWQSSLLDTVSGVACWCGIESRDLYDNATVHAENRVVNFQ
jgi:hypothetical protein